MVKKKEKIWAIIPARAGSKGLKNKNIRKIKNKHLIYFTINDAIKSKMFEKIFFLTDSKKYAKIAESYGAEIPFLRFIHAVCSVEIPLPPHQKIDLFSII